MLLRFVPLALIFPDTFAMEIIDTEVRSEIHTVLNFAPLLPPTDSQSLAMAPNSRFEAGGERVLQLGTTQPQFGVLCILALSGNLKGYLTSFQSFLRRLLLCC
jgi:hypothetical protein